MKVAWPASLFSSKNAGSYQWGVLNILSSGLSSVTLDFANRLTELSTERKRTLIRYLFIGRYCAKIA